MSFYLHLINTDKIDEQSIIVASEILPLDSDITLIGRSSSAHYNISLKKFGREIISRIHAEIRRNQDGRFEVFDTDAMNGLFVNRVSLKGRSHILSQGDIVQFGGKLVRF